MAEQTPLTPHQKWLQTMAGCHRQRRFKQWSMGDALNQAQADWKKDWGRKGDMWQEASDSTGHKVDSLYQYARVAATFPASQRFEAVSFSCYQAIAGLKSAKKRWWLVNKALTEKLSSDAVREVVKKIQKKAVKAKKRKLTVQITVGTYSKLQILAVTKKTTMRKTIATLLEQSC